MVRSLAGLLVVASAFAPSAFAADCPGTPGYTLGISPNIVPIGTDFQVTIGAPMGSAIVLLVSPNGGSTQLPFGTLCVAPPLSTFAFTMQSESVSFPHHIDCIPAYIGLKGYLQFVAAPPSMPFNAISNSQTVTLKTGPCTGDLATFTQGGWGAKCAGNNPGCLRDTYFAQAFPNGLVIGDADGIDGDSAKALKLATSAAVQNFLPSGGSPGKLTADLLNPTGKTPAGVFAGQLVAAKLSVGFDNAGFLDGYKGADFVKLNGLIFIDHVHAKLLGKTVAQVIAFADLAISGAVAMPIDVDGDNVGDVGFSDLSDALDKLNNNFDNGTKNEGTLGVP